MKTISLLLAVAVLVGPSTLASNIPPEKRLPVPEVRDILKILSWDDVKRGRLLAYLAQVDHRPHHTERVLLVTEHHDGRWSLLYAFRHPKGPIFAWRLQHIGGLGVPGSRTFDGKPTAEDVDQFLKDSWWSFEASDGFRLTRGEIFHDVWRATLGFEPNYRSENPRNSKSR